MKCPFRIIAKEQRLTPGASYIETKQEFEECYGVECPAAIIEETWTADGGREEEITGCRMLIDD